MASIWVGPRGTIKDYPGFSPAVDAEAIRKAIRGIDSVPLCGPGCPGSCSVDQDGLRFTEICLPLPPKCWD